MQNIMVTEVLLPVTELAMSTRVVVTITVSRTKLRLTRKVASRVGLNSSQVNKGRGDKTTVLGVVVVLVGVALHLGVLVVEVLASTGGGRPVGLFVLDLIMTVPGVVGAEWTLEVLGLASRTKG